MSPSTLADHLDIAISDLRRFELGEERIAPNLLVSMARLWDVGIDCSSAMPLRAAKPLPPRMRSWRSGSWR